ncbi:hypothetical protein [Streptomyces sp. NPDC048603]|uniref:hypothetical protein n=1 Tax=Streptomyces sp. NPDC048603 TaxID=3365577 RepID=UPI00371849BC
MSHRQDLVRALRAAGVPAGHYRIEGVHEPGPPPTDFVYLRGRPDGRWETGVFERGAYETTAVHDSEAGACAHLRTLLGV